VSADPLILPALLRRNTEENSAKAAIVTDEGSISHAELDRESFTLARQLVGAGIGK
jgi:non-ribosomal peptide synthetase component E (peptide arylation enzyme)